MGTIIPSLGQETRITASLLLCEKNIIFDSCDDVFESHLPHPGHLVEFSINAWLSDGHGRGCGYWASLLRPGRPVLPLQEGDEEALPGGQGHDDGPGQAGHHR